MTSAAGTMSFTTPGAAMGGCKTAERPVCLWFPKVAGKKLYVHPFLLHTWSGVLSKVLEDTVDNSAAEEQCINIPPVDEPDTAAWEDALAAMYPSNPPFKVTWDNAAHLLELAHKYDMPYVTSERGQMASRQCHCWPAVVDE